MSRVDTAVDNLLDGLIAEGRDDLKPLLGKAAVANAELAYRTFITEFGGQRFVALRGKRRSRVQRPLWASTSVKNPAYDDLLYVTSLMARDTVNTMPRATIDTLMERGIDARHAVDESGETAERVQSGLMRRGDRHGRGNVLSPRGRRQGLRRLLRHAHARHRGCVQQAGRGLISEASHHVGGSGVSQRSVAPFNIISLHCARDTS